jgi:hypothetical protein
MAAFRDQSILVVDGRLVHDEEEEVLMDAAVVKRAKARTITALNLAFLLEKTNEQVLPAGPRHSAPHSLACSPAVQPAVGEARRAPSGLADATRARRAAYKFIGYSLNVNPSQLGSITLARGMVQALTSPLAGLLGDRLNRCYIVSFGAILWGVMTVAIAASTNLAQVRP